MPECPTSAHFFAETEPWMAAASVTEYGDPADRRGSAARPLAAAPAGSRRSRTDPARARRAGHQRAGRRVDPRRTRRCAPPASPTELLLLPGEGHTIVGHEGRLASTRLIVDWHARWTAVTARPRSCRRILDGYPAGSARRGGRSARPDPTRVTPRSSPVLDGLGIDGLRDAAQRLDQVRVRQGISFIADIDGELQEQPFPLDPVPRVAVRR